MAFSVCCLQDERIEQWQVLFTGMTRNHKALSEMRDRATQPPVPLTKAEIVAFSKMPVPERPGSETVKPGWLGPLVSLRDELRPC
eukprot:7589272-Lingulodinium_polyedra.AAC.1